MRLSGMAGARRIKRTYNVRLVRRDLSFSISEVAELFGIHPQAVRQWIKGGLHTIDDRRPFLIHGSELIRFLTERQSGRKRRCGPEQFFCFRCRAPRRPRGGHVTARLVNKRQLTLAGQCEQCGSSMNRAGSVQRFEDYKRIFIVETIEAPRLEEDAHPHVIHHLQEIGDHDAIQPQE